MSSATETDLRRSYASILPPDIVNWPVQKPKVWRGKGHPPTWTELRHVAREAVDDGLKNLSLEQLVDIVRTPCRAAGLRAARDMRDKNARVKRDYYNMVRDLLEDAVKKQAEERRKFAGTVPVTCRSGSGGTVMKADDVGWETVGKDTVMLGQVHIFEGSIAELASKIEALRLETGGKSHKQEEASSGETNFLNMEESIDGELGSDDLEILEVPVEEESDGDEWVYVGHELESSWVSVCQTS